MKTVINFFAICICTAIIFSCSELNRINTQITPPEDAILIGNSKMIIYQKKPVTNKSDQKKYGYWEYWVTDATAKGFMLVTNEEYNKNDTLRFIVK